MQISRVNYLSKNTGMKGAYKPTPWYLVGNISPANCLAAYQPLGASSLSSSYVNLANPGTYDASPGVAPFWTEKVGWSFNGVDQWLDTGITPNETTSVVVLFSDGADRLNCLLGSYSGNDTTRFEIFADEAAGFTYTIYGHANNLYVAPGGHFGVLGVSGQQGYKNGIAEGGTIPGTWAGTATATIGIGRRNGATAIRYGVFKCQAIAIYDITLSADQMLALAIAMQHINAIPYFAAVKVGETYNLKLWGNITCDDLVNWNAVTKTYSYTPISNEMGTIKSVTFTINGIEKNLSIIIFNDWTTAVEYASNPVLGYGHGAYDAYGTDAPYLRDYQKIGNTYYALTQCSHAPDIWNYIGLFTSTDLTTWAPYPGVNPIFSPGVEDERYLLHPTIIKIGDTYYVYYSAAKGTITTNNRIYYATSPDLINWTKQGIALSRLPTGQACTPSVIKIGDTYYMYYWDMQYYSNCHTNYAISLDGINWTDVGETFQMLVSDWDYGKTIQAPAVSYHPNGFYELTYSTYWPNHQEIGYAVSIDGVNWIKYQGLIADEGAPGTWNELFIGDSIFYYEGGIIYMFASGMRPAPTFYDSGGLFILTPP